MTEAELALDSERYFLALRVKTFAAIGAYLQHSMPAFVLNAGTLAGVYRTPAIHVDITAVFSQHQSDAAISRQWPPRSGLRDRAHGRSRGRRD